MDAFNSRKRLSNFLPLRFILLFCRSAYCLAAPAVDLDGDGRLARGEISEVLGILGMPNSADDLDILFASASEDSQVEGLTMEEFVETMMLESGSGVGVISNSLRPYILANADTTTKKTYKSRLV